jgi:hypothetical protein
MYFFSYVSIANCSRGMETPVGCENEVVVQLLFDVCMA